MRLDRLLSIVITLLNSDRVTAQELARRFEVTVRTIYRDLDAIQAAGVPVVAFPGNTGGYGIVENYRLDRQLLTLKDMATILTGLRGIRATLPSGELDRAIEKVSSLVPREKKDVVELYEEQVAIDMTGWYFDERRREILRRLHKAVVSQRPIQFTYRNLRGIQAERTVEPMTLLFKGSAWYLFGWCRGKEGFRLFHTGRMDVPELLPVSFVRRPGHWRDYLSMTGEPANMVDLVLRFPERLRLKVEEYFSVDQIETRDGFLVARMSMPDDEWVDAMILGYGGNAEVLEPASVRRRIAEAAARMHQTYEKSLPQT